MQEESRNGSHTCLLPVRVAFDPERVELLKADISQTLTLRSYICCADPSIPETQEICKSIVIALTVFAFGTMQ